MKKTNSRTVARATSKKSLKSRKNDYNGLDGVFTQTQGYGTLSPSTYPFQLGGASQYNPITLNRILLSYSYLTFGIIQTFIDQPVEDGLRGGVDIECDQLSEDDIRRN